MKSHEMDCPYCGEQMAPVKAACGRCGVAVEARFRPSRVAMLPRDQAAFLAEYILAGFSLKALEKRVGMSYPAVRARLDRIVEGMKVISGPADSRNRARQAILDRLERGEMKADEAVAMIEEL
ncbi:MAG: DUF2089 family protein [Planctomycetia bacterium]|nr:DUF2089 family protein [Planctomycetia bacterium]